MTARETKVLELAAQELEDFIDAIDRLGMGYAASYAEYLLSGRQQKRYPRCPAGLRPELAKAVREAVLDSAAVVR